MKIYKTTSIQKPGKQRGEEDGGIIYIIRNERTNRSKHKKKKKNRETVYNHILKNDNFE